MRANSFNIGAALAVVLVLLFAPQRILARSHHRSRQEKHEKHKKSGPTSLQEKLHQHNTFDTRAGIFGDPPDDEVLHFLLDKPGTPPPHIHRYAESNKKLEPLVVWNFKSHQWVVGWTCGDRTIIHSWTSSDGVNHPYVWNVDSNYWYDGSGTRRPVLWSSGGYRYMLEPQLTSNVDRRWICVSTNGWRSYEPGTTYHYDRSDMKCNFKSWAW